MKAKDMFKAYIKQSGRKDARANHYAHTNGTTHTNCSGSHSDSKQQDGSGHGDHYDSSSDY